MEYRRLLLPILALLGVALLLGGAAPVEAKPDLSVGETAFTTAALGYMEGPDNWVKRSGGDPYFHFQVEVLNSGNETEKPFKVGLVDPSDDVPVGVDVMIEWNGERWSAIANESTALPENRSGTPGYISSDGQSVTFMASAADLGIAGVEYPGDNTAYSFFLVVDIEDQIDESDERNNRDAINILAVREHLTVGGIRLAASVTLGEGGLPANKPPTVTIDAEAPSEVPGGVENATTIAARGFDPDGLISRYEWTSSRDGLLVAENVTGEPIMVAFVVDQTDGVWRVRLSYFDPAISVTAAHLVLLDPAGNIVVETDVRDVYGVGESPGYGISFRDNDYNGFFTALDEFRLKPGVGELAGYAELEGYHFRLLSHDEQRVGSVGLNTSLLSPGRHTLSLRVQDDGGAWSKPATLTIMVGPAGAWEILGFPGLYVIGGTIAMLLLIVVVVVVVIRRSQAPVIPLSSRPSALVPPSSRRSALPPLSSRPSALTPPVARVPVRGQAAPVFGPPAPYAAIECPGCGSRMNVPKLGQKQDVKCASCGLSGEIEI